MDNEAAAPDNNIANSPSAPEFNEKSGGGPTAPPTSPAATPHHHRRSKREKYSVSRFVARPSSRKMNSPSDNDTEGDVAAAKDGKEKLKEQMDVKTEEAASVEGNRPEPGGDSEALSMKSENETTSPPINNDDNKNTNTADDTPRTTTRRRTPRAHAAPKSYTEPPDNIDDEQMNIDDNNIDSEEETDDVIHKTCHDGTIVQISTIKLVNKKGRSLCKVIGCGKNDQMGNEGYCRSHFRLLAEQPEQEEEEEEIEEQEGEEEEVEEQEEEEEDSKPPPPPQAAATAAYFDPSPEKPRKGSTVRILHGDSTGLEGDITKVTIGGWCTIDNPNVPKPIRMSSLEVVRQNGPPLPKKSPGRKKWSREVVESVTTSSRRGGGGRSGGSGGRPVRERKPPQSLLMAAASASEAASSSPMSPSRPRRSTRGATTPSASSSSSPKRDSSSSSVRRSRRGPTPSPKYADVEDEEGYDDEEEEEEEDVRPRGRRGRASSTTPSKPSSTTTTTTPKSSHLCKAPSCTKYRQGACEGYCTTCYKLSQAPKDPRLCKVRHCTKIHQYKKDGYCFRHYREFVLEGGVEEEEVEEEEVSPPKKRARRTVKQEVDDDDDEEEDEEEDDDVLLDEDGEAIFDEEPRRGTQEQQFRLYCKVKLCDKFSQGRHKDGMCFKHFKQYGFVGEKKKIKKKTKKKKKLFTMTKKSRSRSAVGKSSPAVAAAAADIDGEIGVDSLVMVKERRGKGMNKPGGVGRVTKVYIDDEGLTVYDVKYVLGGREKGVDTNSLWLHDMDAKSPMKPPPSFDEEGDVAMLDEDDESIGDDELEGYDEFSLSQLDVPDQSVLDQRALRREEQLNALSGNNVDDDYDEHNLRLEENWECAKCGGLNRPTATSRCTTCQSYRVEKNASEDALHERTRYELLKGNDFWICTNCVIGVPSLLMPCGRCHSSIPFVPLTMPEFEDFVRHQRRIKRKREEEMQLEWDQKLEEISEEWGDRKEKEPVATTKSKKQKEVWSNLPCKVVGCKEICAPDCEGFCEDHFRSVIIIEEPEAYPIVRPEDKQLITDYFYLAYEQFRPCVLQDWERTTKHKDKNVPRGHPGIACKHCFGRENPTLRSMGRYFPTTEGSLYQQTFTSNIVKHLMECPHCPSKVKSRLVSIKEELDNAPSDGKKSAKFVGEKGGRGKFFHRIWCRLHGIHFDVEEVQSPKKKRKKT